MMGVDQGCVFLDSDRWVEPSTEVELKLDRIALTGRVRYCNGQDNHYRTCVAVGAEARGGRATARFPMDEPGTLVVVGDSGTARFNCHLTDFSRSGLGLKSPREIAVDTLICIETDSIVAVGRVRRCAPRNDGTFRVGMSVTDVLTASETTPDSQWSIASLRLRLAEIILGRPIELPRRTIGPSSAGDQK